MNLGEFYIAVRALQGPEANSDPAMLRLGLSFALQELAGIAADIGGSRMLYSFPLDVVQDQYEYKIPQHIRTIKGVDRLDVRDRPYPLTYMSFGQRGHADEAGMTYGEGTGGFDGYWVTHSTLHITPPASAGNAAKLRVWAYAAPPVPTDEGESLAIPLAALPWVIAKTAEMASPPPQMVPLIERAIAKREAVLRRWFFDTVKDIPPSVISEGVLE